ncbi:MAG: hypothetical protein Q8K75_04125 [Chlamydiales bacterium]|nr:hypothetical protein [Chlamydiales bacterium]
MRWFLAALVLVLMPQNICFSERVLSVDIGGTRVKAAIIDSDWTSKELQSAKIFVMSSVNYLNENLPSLLDPKKPGSLIELVGLDFDRASILVPADVIDGEEAVRPDLNLPTGLRRKFEEALGKPVAIEQDAVGGLEGFLYWSQLAGDPVEYPVVRVAFGTGLAVAFADQDGEVRTISISDMQADWTPLSPILGTNIDKGTKLHGNIRKAFERVRDGQPKEALIHAVNTFLQIMLNRIQVDGIHVASLVLGGGWANLLNESEIDLGPDLGEIKVVVVNGEYAQKSGVDPDIIPLLNAFYQPISVEPTYHSR